MNNEPLQADVPNRMEDFIYIQLVKVVAYVNTHPFYYSTFDTFYPSSYLEWSEPLVLLSEN